MYINDYWLLILIHCFSFETQNRHATGSKSLQALSGVFFFQVPAAALSILQKQVWQCGHAPHYTPRCSKFKREHLNQNALRECIEKRCQKFLELGLEVSRRSFGAAKLGYVPTGCGDPVGTGGPRRPGSSSRELGALSSFHEVPC